MLSPLPHHQSRLETQSLQQEEARSLEVEGPRLPWPRSMAPQSCPRGQLTAAREAIAICPGLVSTELPHQPSR